ncbi:alpha/beta fold hydrolase [Pseudovibrio brasiliensis]|uniref:Alpha/beta hydrolase n=1 Tax=Pseudovibrio brasiliensis TaxID=1898042 RepID=A0ABX8ATU4_9HYPH|nr:alpha/beta hydrolase [Pseudovibrio brasiliensis]
MSVILPDRRGHGYSSRSKRSEDFGMHMAGDISRILDAEGLDMAHLAGFSQGSEIAWRTALKRPDQVCSLFLISSGWPGPELDNALNGYTGMLKWLPQTVKIGSHQILTSRHFRRLFHRWLRSLTFLRQP